VVLDVGAHIGTFALPAAAAGCRVLALEPAPANAALLEAAAARNGFRELEVVAAAASDRPGPVFFHPNGPWGHVATGRSRGGAIEVPAVRLDDLVRDRGVDRVALVKLDVEGGELCALRGTARLLSRAGAAAVLYESNGHTLELAGATPNRLVGELERHDYESYIVEPDRLVRRRASELQVETVADLVAVQGGPPALPGWRVAPGLTLEERVTSLLAEATYEAPAHRAYAARALARAGEEVVSDPMVARVLGRLRNDPVPAVRADAAWSRKTAV
jgi:FkbM family methyltransferase